MKSDQKNIFKPILPLIISIFVIIITLLLSFKFNIYQYPFWIKEDGIIESLSVLGYLVATILILVKGKWSYVKQYYYFFILIIMFGLRELDFHKKFTTMGIFKSKFYLSSEVPIFEKLIGILIILFIVHIIITIYKKHSQDFITKIRSFSSIHIGALIIFLTLFFSKTLDGLSRKLDLFNIIIEEQTSKHVEVLEEVLELGIPLLIIATLVMYFSVEKKEGLKDPSYNNM